MSVNKAYKGRRFRTKEYDKYQAALMLMLPKLSVPNSKLCITIEYGLSSKLADIDNPNKQFLDTLTKKYGFNDKIIYKLNTEKVDVPKGGEYIKFKIEPYVQN